MIRNKLKEHVVGEKDDYKLRSDKVRVNVYGASAATDDEIFAVYGGAKDLLDWATGSNRPLSGYEIHAYDTYVGLSQKISDTPNDLIDDAYDSLGKYDDEHALLLWSYWDHESDSTTCGPGDDQDPCPETFMMGHDIDNDASYPADKRQPYEYVTPSETSLYDIQMGFVYANQLEQDPKNYRLPAAHELGHALVEYDAYQDQNLVPGPSAREQHPDHYIGRREYNYSGGYYYNTVMATDNNPEAVNNGKCNTPDSSSELPRGSDCFQTAMSETIDYYDTRVS